MADGSESDSKKFLDKLTSNPYTLIMKNKTAPLNFVNVCNIHAYLSLAIKDEIRAHKHTKQYWGVNNYFTRSSRKRIGEMISAYRASKNIEIVY